MAGQTKLVHENGATVSVATDDVDKYVATGVFARASKSGSSSSSDSDDSVLKGKALDDALEAAGLPKTGTADEKRAALAAADNQ